MTDSVTQVHQAIYQSGLAGFTQVYKTLNEMGCLPLRQQQWLEAAAEATDKLNLSSQQTKAVLLIPAKTPANEIAPIAALPNAAEVFYRMSLLDRITVNLTHGLANDPQRARRWMKIRHSAGPYEAKRPINSLIKGEAYELKTLLGYIRHNI